MAQESSPTRSSVGVHLDDSTRERIERRALERKRSAKSKTDRKTAIFASMDSIEHDDGDFSMARRSLDSVGQHKTKKGTTGSASSSSSNARRHDLSMSEHTGKRIKESHNGFDPRFSLQESQTSRSEMRHSAGSRMSAATPSSGERPSLRRESSTRRDRKGALPSPHAMAWKSPFVQPINMEEEMDRIFDDKSSPKKIDTPKAKKLSDEPKPEPKLGAAGRPGSGLSSGRERESLRQESSTRRERTGRSSSPHALKRRTASPGPMKKEDRSSRKQRSSSLGPLKKERAKPSNSIRPLKAPSSPVSRPSSPVRRPSPPARRPSLTVRRPSSPVSRPSSPVRRPSPPARRPSLPVRRPSSPGKRPSSPGKRPSSPGKGQSSPGKRPSSPVKPRSSSRASRGSKKAAKDASRTLEEQLGGLDPTFGRKKNGAASIASAPVISRTDSARKKRTSTRQPASSRRARSADDTPLLLDDNIPPGRSASTDDEMSIGDIGEFMLNDKKERTKSPGRLSQRLSNGLRSFSRFAGFGGSGRSLVGSQDESQDPPEQRPASRKARGSTRAKKPAARSNSAGPLGDRPGMKRTDRRAGLTKSKQNDNGGGGGGDDDDDDDKKPEPNLPGRAQSMMLHREATRRGKSTSLMDLQQYKDEEIHSTSYFASNHVLVNRERMKRGLRPLTRNIAMDEMARAAAQAMSETEGKSPLPATYVGNILRGESIRAIHRAIMQNKEGRERHNLLSPYFQEFGIGTSKGKDGMLYICQLFSERIVLTITDTT